MSDEKKVLSALVDDYINQYQLDWEYHHQAVISPLEVDALASKIAKAYEKVRKVVDWKEENLLRRAAIERILKRRMLSELYGISIMPNLNAKEMAEPMVLELMRSGYFDNGRIAKHQVKELEKVLGKYIEILSRSKIPTQNSDKHIKNKMAFYTWMLEIAACEIEEILAPGFKENALMNLMTNVIYERTKIIPSKKMEDLDKLIQTYIATHRTLYNFDEPIIAFDIIKIRYPYWVKDNQESIDLVVENVIAIRKQIEADLESPEGKRFFKLCGKYDAAYRLIGDVAIRINNTPAIVRETLLDEEKLDALVDEIYHERRKSLKKRLFRSAIYSTLSIFVAGAFSFVIFEGPVARWAGQEFSILSLFVDLLIPSLVMFLLVIAIQPPRKKNFPIVKKEIKKILYKSDKDDRYEIDFNKKPSKWMSNIFILVSALAGLAAMRFIFWIFKIANVPWTSMYIDTINVAMVFFSAMAIKEKSKEITIEENVNFFESLLDLFSIPLAKIGQWFSNKWKEYNVVSALMTALVDTPFSTIISVVEDWRNFIKEKRSEIH